MLPLRLAFISAMLSSTPIFAQINGQNSWSGPVTFRNTITAYGTMTSTAPINTASTMSCSALSTSNVSTASLNVTGPTTFTVAPNGVVQRACATVDNNPGLSVLGCKKVTSASAAFLHLGRACEPIAPTAIAVNTWAACRINVEGTADLLLCSAAAGVAIPTGQWCAEVTGSDTADAGLR